MLRGSSSSVHPFIRRHHSSPYNRFQQHSHYHSFQVSFQSMNQGAEQNTNNFASLNMNEKDQTEIESGDFSSAQISPSRRARHQHVKGLHRRTSIDATILSSQETSAPSLQLTSLEVLSNCTSNTEDFSVDPCFEDTNASQELSRYDASSASSAHQYSCCIDSSRPEGRGFIGRAASVHSSIGDNVNDHGDVRMSILTDTTIDSEENAENIVSVHHKSLNRNSVKCSSKKVYVFNGLNGSMHEQQQFNCSLECSMNPVSLDIGDQQRYQNCIGGYVNEELRSDGVDELFANNAIVYRRAGYHSSHSEENLSIIGDISSVQSPTNCTGKRYKPDSELDIMIAREMQEDIATSMIDELCYNDRVDHVRNVDDGNLAPVNSRRQQFHIVNDNTQIVQGILDQANNGRDEEESESDDVGGDLIQQLETLDDAAAAIAEGFSDSLRQREDSDLFAPHTYLQFLNLLYFRRRLQHQHHSDLQRQVIARNEHDLGRASNTSTPAENMQVPFQLHPNRSATRYTHAQSGYSLQEVHIAVESATRDLTGVLKTLKVDDKILAKIDHSAKFIDDVFEYRFVILPRNHPYFELDLEDELRGGLMKDSEWRLLGIRQTRGWEHYGYSRQESNLFLFRRASGTDPRSGKVGASQRLKVEKRKQLLERMKEEYEDPHRSASQFSGGPTTFARRHKKKRLLNTPSKSDATGNSQIESSGSLAPSLITTVPAFGSLQGSVGASVGGVPTFEFIDHSSLMNPYSINNIQLNGNNVVDTCRRIANSINARHLVSVMRTGDVFPQPSGPFLDLPDDDDSVGDDLELLGGFDKVDEERRMTNECFINDLDWLYTSLHMPLYATN